MIKFVARAIIALFVVMIIAFSVIALIVLVVTA
jgi:hypothetical protein